MNAIVQDMKTRMGKAVDALKVDLNGLRAGRASPDLLAPVTVEAYGSRVPLSQVSNVNVLDTRLLAVQVWDQSLVNAVDKAIRDAGLGLNPQIEGSTLRLRLPELIKKMEKDGEASEDEAKRLSDEVQKVTDQFIKTIDDMVAAKEADILKV